MVNQTQLKIAIATPVRNSAEEIPAFFDSLLRLQYPLKAVTLVILESDSSDDTDAVLRKYIGESRDLFRNIIYKREKRGTPQFKDRHALGVQLYRRQILAEVRNDLLALINLKDFDFVLWMDVDAVGYPSTLISDLIAVNQSIVVPHIVWSYKGPTYDRNTWLELRPDIVWRGCENDIPVYDRSPQVIQNNPSCGEVMFEGYSELQFSGNRLYLDDFRKIISPDDPLQAVPIHGVGTALVLIRSEVHIAGIKFPVLPYKRRVESEAFGVLSADRGFHAVALPNYEIIHRNHLDKPGMEPLPHDTGNFFLFAAVLAASLLLFAVNFLKRKFYYKRFV